MGRHDAYRTPILDEPCPQKLGNCRTQKTDGRPVEGCCHRASSCYPHSPLGVEGGQVLPLALQLYGSKRRSSTRKPTDHYQKTRRRLRATHFTIPSRFEGLVQGYSTSTDSSCLLARGDFLKQFGPTHSVRTPGFERFNERLGSQNTNMKSGKPFWTPQ